MVELRVVKVPSPLGVLKAVVRGDCVCDLDIAGRWGEKKRRLEKRFREIRFEEVSDAAEVGSKLESYFAGDLSALDSVDVDTGGTDFQQNVWRQLRRIPVGVTISYGELAKRVGNAKASRGVGAANGRNPVAIIVPCHRVIGADGTLTGYALGLDRKRWLLGHEGALLI